MFDSKISDIEARIVRLKVMKNSGNYPNGNFDLLISKNEKKIRDIKKHKENFIKLINNSK